MAYAIFDTENEDNWTWFMEQLHRAIGDVANLVICTDANKGLENAGVVFPNAEYRECVRHLYQNFMKYYTGDVFTDHLYPAARSYTTGLLQWHMKKIFEFAPDTIEYLETHHNKIWYRYVFSENSKYDYLTNNVSESFNAQVKKFKGLLLHEIVDKLRELIMEKRYLRKKEFYLMLRKN
jgi:transposase-like protein